MNAIYTKTESVSYLYQIRNLIYDNEQLQVKWFENKILFLEVFGRDVALITTFLSQLKQMGVFSKINGILLGTFTKMEENKL